MVNTFIILHSQAALAPISKSDITTLLLATDAALRYFSLLQFQVEVPFYMFYIVQVFGFASMILSLYAFGADTIFILSVLSVFHDFQDQVHDVLCRRRGKVSSLIIHKIILQR